MRHERQPQRMQSAPLVEDKGMIKVMAGLEYLRSDPAYRDMFELIDYARSHGGLEQSGKARLRYIEENQAVLGDLAFRFVHGDQDRIEGYLDGFVKMAIKVSRDFYENSNLVAYMNVLRNVLVKSDGGKHPITTSTLNLLMETVFHPNFEPYMTVKIHEISDASTNIVEFSSSLKSFHDYLSWMRHEAYFNEKRSVLWGLAVRFTPDHHRQVECFNIFMTLAARASYDFHDGAKVDAFMAIMESVLAKKETKNPKATSSVMKEISGIMLQPSFDPAMTPKLREIAEASGSESEMAASFRSFRDFFFGNGGISAGARDRIIKVSMDLVHLHTQMIFFLGQKTEDPLEGFDNVAMLKRMLAKAMEDLSLLHGML